MLSPERWQIVERVFHDALVVPVPQRDAFVDSSCGSDPELCREVESLLAAASDGDVRDSLASYMATTWASDQPPDALVGREIDSYRVLSLLGAGGMGEVYLAEDHSLGRQVALKLLPAPFNVDPSRLRRFTEEARAASALNHPNIITVHHIGAFEGRRFIATEFIDGETLRERLARGPLPVAEAIDVAVQIAAALRAAHDAGIVHRDIKPENLMIRRDGYVKVLDFGLAKLAPGEQLMDNVETKGRQTVSTRAGTVLGTLNYMAPEQASGGTVDARADLYSLGVVLHEMLTGELPPEPGSELREPVESLRLSTRLARIVSRALAIDPVARYQSAEELGHDLAGVRQLLDSRPARVRRWRVAAAGTLAAILIAGAGYVQWARPRSPGSADVEPSLAVLPFQMAGPDTADEYLGVGLADAVITQLGNLPQLRVQPTSSVSKFTQAGLDPIAIGRQLRVDHVLSGLIQRSGDRVRVTVQLVNVRTGTQQWGARIDERAVDLFMLQDTVSREVAAKLMTRVDSVDRERLASGQTRNPDAYRLYLEGRFQLQKSMRPNVERSIELFEQAIARDDRYALAHASLAYAYRMLASGLIGPQERGAAARAREAAERALAIDSDLAEAHAILGVVQYANEWDFTSAETSLRRAVALRPNLAETHRSLGFFLVNTGEFTEAVHELTLARQLDPTSIVIAENLAVALGFSGRDAEALGELDAASKIESSNPRPYGRRVPILERLQRFDDAVIARQTSLRLAGRPVDADRIGRAYAASGYRGVLEYMHGIYDEGRDPRGAASVLVLLERHDEALTELEAAVRNRLSVATSIRSDPSFAPLRNHPRFIEIVRQLGLP